MVVALFFSLTHISDSAGRRRADEQESAKLTGERLGGRLSLAIARISRGLTAPRLSHGSQRGGEYAVGEPPGFLQQTEVRFPACGRKLTFASRSVTPGPGAAFALETAYRNLQPHRQLLAAVVVFQPVQALNGVDSGQMPWTLNRRSTK